MLLAAPLIDFILRALAEGQRGQAELRRDAGFPAQTTMRAQLGRLVQVGAITKHRRNRFPGVLEYELTPVGRELLLVSDALRRWLDMAPEGSLEPGSGAARAAITAFAEGWSTAMLRAIAAGPLSLTELSRVINSLSYPSLERRLRAMRLATLIEAMPNKGRGTPYALTNWSRLAVGPLTVATRWEQRHLATATPAARLDAEALFLLAVPLLEPPAELAGSCRMAIVTSNGRERRLAGVTTTVEDGSVASCVTHLHGDVDAWALGTLAAWLSALIEQDVRGLEFGGNGGLARTLVAGIQRTLFGVPLGDIS